MRYQIMALNASCLMKPLSMVDEVDEVEES
jgi:hypothetical protein